MLSLDNILPIAADLVSIFVIVRFAALKITDDRNYALHLVVIHLSVLLLTIVLQEVKFSLGVAFGLFALFSIMRFRSSEMSLMRLSLLFAVLTLAILNGINALGIYECLLVNAVWVILLLGIFRMAKKEENKLSIEIERERLSADHANWHENLEKAIGQPIIAFRKTRYDAVREIVYLEVEVGKRE